MTTGTPKDEHSTGVVATEKRDRESVLVGKVTGVFGTRGWVKLFSYTRPQTNLLNYPRLLCGNARYERLIVDAKCHGTKLLALLSDIDSREQAVALIGQEIYVERDWFCDDDSPGYYWIDLIGLEVINRDGVILGTIEKMLETGANDVMQVRAEKIRLVPFVMGVYVDQVDLEAGVVTVNWHLDD